MITLIWFISGATLGYMALSLFITHSMERTVSSAFVFIDIFIIWVLLMIKKLLDTMEVE